MQINESQTNTVQSNFVSIIVPNYNHAIYLAERLDSILAQTWKDFELIILDDLSTDHSREVIERYRLHPQVSEIVYNEINSGTTFKQWEKGIALAKGDFIWIAESDDWCEPTLLENLMHGLTADPNTGLAFCQSCMVIQPNKIKEISIFPYYEKTMKGSQFISEYMLYSNRIINASMVVWRKELFSRIDPVYKSFRFSGDWLFWISILQQSEVYISGKVLNYFRKHTDDVSSKIYGSGDNYLEDLRLFQVLYERGVLGKKELLDVVRARYIAFLRDKVVKPDKQKLKAIKERYGSYIPVNAYFNGVYKVKGLVRHLRSKLS